MSVELLKYLDQIIYMTQFCKISGLHIYVLSLIDPMVLGRIFVGFSLFSHS